MKSGSYHHRWLATHPAHLHINLLPGGRSSGLGRQLIARFSAQARATAAGAGGIHLRDARRQREGEEEFFERVGFTVLELPRIVDPFTLEERGRCGCTASACRETRPSALAAALFLLPAAVARAGTTPFSRR